MVGGLLQEKDSTLDDLLADIESDGRYKFAGRLHELPGLRALSRR